MFIPDPDFCPSWLSDLGYQILDTGSWILDLGSRISDPGSWNSDLGSRNTDPGSRIPDLGSLISDPRFRISDPGFWISDPVSWISDYFWKGIWNNYANRQKFKCLWPVNLLLSCKKYGFGIWDPEKVILDQDPGWIRICNNGIIVVYLSFIDIIFIFKGPGTKGQKDWQEGCRAAKRALLFDIIFYFSLLFILF
jgi:hypothetical protein